MFILSTDLGSMENTRHFLDPFFTFLFSDLSQADLLFIQIVIRKLGHLTEYAILSVMWFWVFHQRGGRAGASPVLYALLISVAYAGLDELHHVYVASRTGSIADVGIDSMGAILGLCLSKGGVFVSMSPDIKKRMKCFGWWFSWGVFSTIMGLIVLKGGVLVFWQMLLMTLIVGTASGIGGMVYFGRKA